MIEHDALLDGQEQSYVHACYLSATFRFCIVKTIFEVSMGLNREYVSTQEEGLKWDRKEGKRLPCGGGVHSVAHSNYSAGR